MSDFKPISAEAVPGALDKAEHYRLLNDPAEAESICRDVLRVDGDNQRALILFLLCLTDQFGVNPACGVNEARAVVDRIEGDYENAYYNGLICERQGKAQLVSGEPGVHSVAYTWLNDAQEWYNKAEDLRPKGNDAAILRWNACARMLRDHALQPRPEDLVEPMLE